MSSATLQINIITTKRLLHIFKKRNIWTVYLGHVDSVCDISLVLGGGEGPEPFHEALVQLQAPCRSHCSLTVNLVGGLKKN